MFYLLAAIAGAIDPAELHEACQKIEQDPHFHMVRNVLTQNPNHPVAKNWDCVKRANFHFSHEISTDFPATNQKQSGRCWIFGSLNVLRSDIGKKIAAKDFELSQSYLFFHDKIEKANTFLEKIIDTYREPVDSPIVRHILSRIVEDGGHWHNVADLVKKYGLVPKSVYPENEACNLSLQLNKILQMILTKDAEILRNQLQNGYDIDYVREEKQKMVRELYQILVAHMGAPPTSFDFSYYDKDKKFHVVKNLTPKKFADEYLNTSMEDYVYILNCPRADTPYYSNIRITYTNNMFEGREYTALNLPIEDIKMIAKEAILADYPLAFAADILSQADRVTGIMDSKLFEFGNLYQIDFSMSKASRLAYRLSMPNHLMAFTGVHIEDDFPTRWKVENSWGTEVGKQGFFAMSDNWFNEYVYDVIVPKKFLPDHLKELLDKEPILLDPWDPLWQMTE